MKMLSSEEMQELRTEIAGLSISDERKNELIRFLDAVAISFVDQAFGKSPVQLSLSARANNAFAGVGTCDNLHKSSDFETVDLGNEGALNTKSPTRQPAP